MAGGKLTPRLKMITLMYLVFISMLAMNMSKEVLNGFGIINEKLNEDNGELRSKNISSIENLKIKAQEAPDQFQKVKDDAIKLSEASDKLFDYLENLKKELEVTVADSKDYTSMDGSAAFDERFFAGSKDRKTFINNVNEYLSVIEELIGEEHPETMALIKKNFDVVSKIKDREGIPTGYMEYHFMGFPLISTITKFSFIQNNLITVESDILGKFLSGQLSRIASMDNYTTLLELEKTAFYDGEIFNGAIVLGRKDASTKPNRVELKLGNKVLAEDEYTIEDGKVKLNVMTGAPGDYLLEGKLVFLQKGKEIEVPVNQLITVISRPNQAVISAEKMNVVYRGVDNPITISLPGVPSNKLKVSAPGLSKKGDIYMIRPGKGREVKVTVSAIIPGGTEVTSSKVFRIKGIPRPTGTVSGQSEELKLPISNLSIATIGAVLEDFDFDLRLKVNSFKISIPGQPSVNVSGYKMDSRAKNVLKRAKKGDLIQIFDINASIIGNSSYKLKKVSPVIVRVR